MTKSWYDSEEDIIGIELNKGTYWKSIETQSGLVIDISKNGKILGLEIPHAKKVLAGSAKKVLQAIPAR